MQPKRRWKRASASSSGSTDLEPASPPSQQQLYALALKALTRRPYSVRELEDKLLQSCDDDTTVSQVIDRLKAASYLDDRKYVELFIQTCRDRKRYGRFRIAAQLKAKGLNPRLVQEVLDSNYPADDEQEPLRRALERKLRTLPPPVDEKKLARLYNHLLRCGFPGESVRRELDERFRADWEL